MNIHSLSNEDLSMRESDKRVKIMQTALELFAEQGFHGVPMTMIAEKAKVAIGTIYIYFASKDVLIKELFTDIEEKITAALQEGQPAQEPIRERYLHFAKGLIAYFTRCPLHFRYIEQYMNSPYGVSQRRDKLLNKIDQQDLLSSLFNEGIAHQVIKDVPFTVLSSVGVGPLIFLVRDHIVGLAELDNRLIEQAAEACWDGIKRSSS